ncbi:putative drug exporter of the RND superfamily [Pelagirhabdus alkalitolerans]|uniref:Putative drug exporter of the RND superfamily n=1 Tax=Pelagirhabdus alkalitolerans TaxID=1612202 RepID=A0A1G6IX08_9BACI|nr:MMPL family transporter [Pelagirhabdus alkalitolerans]SDC11009.1 putative drug exporter of the RND superfamily [Pelagirhabdus alkalitolerans]
MIKRLSQWRHNFKSVGFVHVNPIIWVIAVVALFMVSPDISQFVHEEGMPSAPEGYPSEAVDDIIERDDGFTGHEIIVVYQNENESSFTDDEKDQIEERAESIRYESDLNLYDVMSPFDGEEAEDRLLSEDEDVLVVVLQSNIESNEYADVRGLIDDEMAVDGMNHYQTGEIAINEDVLVTTEEGLDRSTIITVILVFVVLAIIFKSPVAPFIPLLMLGTVYVISVSLVSVLIDRFGFPVSQFTEVFILIVVFGVGTDYCILVMQRFQEEAIHEPNQRLAMKSTMKGARNSVLYSAMTGFIGFAAIGLANFDLYRSAVGVTFSVIFVILAIWMLFPFIFQVLGNRIFWPSQQKVKEPNNWLWGKLGYFALYKTKYAIILILIATIPLALMYDQSRSFDNLDEIDPSFDSVQGYDLVDEAFGEGDLFFTTLVIESNEGSWYDVQAIPYLELLSLNLEKIDNVDEVRTISRPEGEVLEEATVSYLAEELRDGLEEVSGGLSELEEGQLELLTELENQEPTLEEAEEGIYELLNGVEESRDGVNEIDQNLMELAEGLEEGESGLEELITGQNEMLDELEAFSEVPGELEERLQTFFDESDGYVEDLSRLIDGLEQLNDVVSTFNEQSVIGDELLNDLNEGSEQFLDVLILIQELSDESEEIDEAFDEFIESLESVDVLLATFQAELDELNEDEVLELLESILGFPIDEVTDEDFELIEELDQVLSESREQLAEAIEMSEDIQGTMDDAFESLDEELPGLIESIEMVDDVIETLESLEQQFDADEIDQELSEAIEELEAFEEVLQEITERENELFDVFEQIDMAINELQSGIREMQAGTEEIMEGLSEAVEGIYELSEALSELDDGLGEIEQGLSDFAGEFDQVETMLELLITSVDEMRDGTLEIDDGLDEAIETLDDIIEKSGHPLGGLIFMRDLIESEEFEQVWEQYTTPSEMRVAFVEIGLTVNPYSDEAFDTLDEIEEMTYFSLQDTFLEDTDLAFEGITSNNRDLRDVSDSDFIFTAAVMLVGIFIALTILFKSLIMPIYVIGSLIITYICAMSITELIFVNWLDYDGLMWATPFFAFVLLMALGVDYSIFLLGRLSDDLTGDETSFDELILTTMQKVGSTVLSAGVILGGTFASLYPSGVLTLMQVSTIVIAGIIFYTLIMLPLFVPIMFKWIGSYNWWPFKR